MGKILPGPWAEQQAKNLEVSHLSGSIDANFTYLYTEVSLLLEKIRLPFQSESDINPVHCKKAFDALQQLHDELMVLTKHFGNTTSPMLMLSPFRYPLLIDLYVLLENISHLMDLLDKLRVSCLKASRKKHSRKQEIVVWFDKIMHQLNDCLFQVSLLEKDRCVQEQRLRRLAKL